MNNKLCPCSELEWKPEHYSLEHHPDCAEQQGDSIAAIGERIRVGLESVIAKLPEDWNKLDRITVQMLNERTPVQAHCLSAICPYCGASIDVKVAIGETASKDCPNGHRITFTVRSNPSSFKASINLAIPPTEN